MCVNEAADVAAEAAADRQESRDKELDKEKFQKNKAAKDLMHVVGS